ncbi:phosphatidylinositol N-acetylglucosaminyltransferase [Serendipita vermifera]|nr:phosphatidylinositol N-acetylglucosaminyltransferase [Serendipita vermifera]
MTAPPFKDQKWERILWKKLPFPDNYVSKPHFLASLRKNANFTPYTYPTLVLASTSVSQHVASIFIFLAIFIRLKENSTDPRIIIWLSILLFFVGWTSWEITLFMQNTPLPREIRSKIIRSSIIVFMALVALAPVLKTLTEATSSDSIWALSFSLFILHTLLADYTTPLVREGRERLTSVLSMNAAISASVVLASRLNTDFSVFALMLFSVQDFALFPLLRRQLHLSPPIIRVIMTIILSMTAIYLMGALSPLTGWILFGLLVFISGVAPAVIVWAQRYKNEIRGEWDVAVPEIG